MYQKALACQHKLFCIKLCLSKYMLEGSFHVKSITSWPCLHHPTPINLMKFGKVVGSHEYIKIKNKPLGQVSLKI